MRRLALIVLSSYLASPAPAASLSEVPPAWAGRIDPIAAQRLEELEAASAQRIRQTGERLGDMLGDPGTDAASLASLYGRLGALYAVHRMYAGAELAFGNAGALDPRGFRWPYYLAHIALEQGEAERALGHLATAARVDPDYRTLPLRRGEALLGLNRLGEARQAFTEVVEFPTLRAAALYGLAQIDLLERNWGAAADRYAEVLALQPDADAAQYPLGQALVGLGRRDEARRHLTQRGVTKPDYPDPLVEELRSLQTGPRFHFEAAIDAVERQDYGAATEAFAAGLAGDPANARARTSYARTLWISGRRDEAKAELERAVADGPTETLPRFLLALMHDAVDDTIAAGAGYRGVLEIDPGHQGALSYLANLSLRLGDHVSAAGFYERAIAAGATHQPIFLHYWGALLHAGTPEAILRDRLTTFDRRYPEPPLFRYLLAKLLAVSAQADVADVERAITIARELHDTQPIPPHTEVLALSLAAAGDFAQAQQLQEGLVEFARVTGAFDRAARLEVVAVAYRDRRLPETPWAVDARMFMPSPADPELAMRNYPAGQPY